MILLDTHIWVWYVHQDSKLEKDYLNSLKNHHKNGLFISKISLWEVAKLVEIGKLKLPFELEKWFEMSIEGSNIYVLDLSQEIIIQSTRLPSTFHKDPADQIIAATSIIYKIPLATKDAKLISYPCINKFE